MAQADEQEMMKQNCFISICIFICSLHPRSLLRIRYSPSARSNRMLVSNGT